MTISLDELQRRLADTQQPPGSLAHCFESAADDERAPLRPCLRVAASQVDIGDDGVSIQRAALLAAQARGWSRLRRRQLWQRRAAFGHAGPLVVALGDSWFQYPMLVEDVVDRLLDAELAVRSLDDAGDTLDALLRRREHIDALRDTGGSVLLLSVGGADALGGGRLGAHLRDFDASRGPADHLMPSWSRLLDHTLARYERVLREVEALPERVITICHGYDRPLPNAGRWLGAPMLDHGIEDRAVQRAIAALMIDQFNAGLRQLCAQFGDEVIYLDLRGSVGGEIGDWLDELHPGAAGFARVASAFADAIARAAERIHAAAPVAAGGHGLCAGPLQATAVAPKKRLRRGRSLHVGLNRIDAAHYGTEGLLQSCEFDAHDMRQIALDSGFESCQLLLGVQATRDAVKQHIDEAAAELAAGDLYFVSFSGLGAQLPDFNRDEVDDGADETFCLYDGMLIDDEMYAHWRRFADEVRVLIVCDTCHGLAGAGVPFAPGASRGRCLAPEFSGRTYRSHRSFYRRIGSEVRGADEGGLGRDLAWPLRCSVLLFSACQDNQASEDGAANGRFTQQLLSVWNDGRFDGDYRLLHQRIVAGMPPTQSPQLHRFGKSPERFLAQRPFAV